MKNVLKIMLFLLLAGSPFCFGQTEGRSRASLYTFSEHFKDLTSYVILDKGDLKQGTIKSNRLEFQGLTSVFDITLEDQVFNEETYKAILLQPVPVANRYLLFRGIPSGSTLRLYYGVTDSSFEKKQNTATIYLSVKAGNKELKRIAIMPEKGWNYTDIRLGPIPMFLTNVDLLVEITIDGPSVFQLGLNGEILP